MACFSSKTAKIRKILEKTAISSHFYVNYTQKNGRSDQESAPIDKPILRTYSGDVTYSVTNRVGWLKS